MPAPERLAQVMTPDMRRTLCCRLIKRTRLPCTPPHPRDGKMRAAGSTKGRGREVLLHQPRPVHAIAEGDELSPDDDLVDDDQLPLRCDAGAHRRAHAARCPTAGAGTVGPLARGRRPAGGPSAMAATAARLLGAASLGHRGGTWRLVHPRRHRPSRARSQWPVSLLLGRLGQGGDRRVTALAATKVSLMVGA